MNAYSTGVALERRHPLWPPPRWELYRLLADPVRVRLLGLASIQTLAVGELAELLGEGQPKVSRHASALREAGLLQAYYHGTWTFLELAHQADADPVVADAVAAGVKACEADGSRARIEEVVAARDTPGRAFFAKAEAGSSAGPPAELGAYLLAMGSLIDRRALAVDVGTGSGALLEVLAPLFERVIAIDRSAAQLELARERARRRGFTNVTVVEGDVFSPDVKDRVHGEGGHGADVVFASRLLHHAPTPAKTMRALSELARPAGHGAPGGAVFVLDYATHQDATLVAQQADIWYGFAPDELLRLAHDAGLSNPHIAGVPAAWRGEGPDRHLDWHLLIARRGVEADHFPRETHAPTRSRAAKPASRTGNRQ